MAAPSAYTPGPWLVEGATVYALHGDDPRNRFSALVQSGRRDDASEPERAANARLMAAAPELLEALRYARRFLKPAEHDTAFVDAAIAKALGEKK